MHRYPDGDQGNPVPTGPAAVREGILADHAGFALVRARLVAFARTSWAHPRKQAPVMTGLRWCDEIACQVVTFDGVNCPGCGSVGYPIQHLAAAPLPAPVRDLLATKLAAPSALTGAVR